MRRNQLSRMEQSVLAGRQADAKVSEAGLPQGTESLPMWLQLSKWEEEGVPGGVQGVSCSLEGMMVTLQEN